MALREVFARFGFDIDDSKLKAAEQAVDGFAKKLQQVGGLLAGGLVAKALFDFAKETANIGDAISDNAQRIGITTQSYQALGYAAQLSASNAEELSVALLALQDRAVDAARGSKETAAAFSRLGLKVKDANGHVKSADVLFVEAAEKISKMDNAAQQTAAAVDLFSRQGRALLPLLKGGAAGIAALTAEAEALGGGFSEAAVAASAEFNDSLDRSRFVVRGLRGQLALALLPAMRWLIDLTTKVAAWFARMARVSEFFRASLVVLGVATAAFGAVALRAFLPLLLPFLKAGLLLGLLILIVDDLLVLFKGGKSVIGDAIDALFGVGAAGKAIQWLKQQWQDLNVFIKESIDYISNFGKHFDEALEKAGAALKKLIGEKGMAVIRDALPTVGESVDGTQESRDAMRRNAVSVGQSVRFKDESPEIAALLNGRARVDMVARASVSSSGTMVNAPSTLNLTINAANADAKEVVREIKGGLDDFMRAKNREAANALVRGRK